MEILSQNTHPMFGHLFNNLKEHAELTATGLDSEQASEVVFHKLRLIQTDDARSYRFSHKLFRENQFFSLVKQPHSVQGYRTHRSSCSMGLIDQKGFH